MTCLPDLRSDALVFFRATGDLAYKQIFPALQALVRRGAVSVRLVGGAQSGWNVSQPGFGARSQRDTA